MTISGSRTIVVIVNFNSADLISRCVATFPVDDDIEFFVMDNASPGADESTKLTELALHDRRVRPISSPVNVGFGAAVNTAISAAAPDPTDTLWVLNPDVEISEGALTALSETLAEVPDAVLSPVIYYLSHPSEVWFGGGEIDLTAGVTRHITSTHPDSPVRECGFLTGAAMFMRASTWEKLGGFREDLFMYWEDADLCLRARARGIPLLVVPSAGVLHHVGATTSRDGAKSLLWYEYMARNRLIVCASRRLRVFDLVLGRGSVATARFIWRAFKEPGPTLARLKTLTRGHVDGFRAVSAQRGGRG